MPFPAFWWSESVHEILIIFFVVSSQICITCRTVAAVASWSGIFCWRFNGEKCLWFQTKKCSWLKNFKVRVKLVREISFTSPEHTLLILDKRLLFWTNEEVLIHYLSYLISLANIWLPWTTFRTIRISNFILEPFR